jgi:hypothetical protein
MSVIRNSASRGSFVRVQMPRDPSDTTSASDGQAEATLLPP